MLAEVFILSRQQKECKIKMKILLYHAIYIIYIYSYKTSEDRQRFDCDFRKTDDIQFCGYRSFHSEANETLI